MDILNQAKSLIEKSQSILIATPQEIQGDTLGSALALFFTLKNLGKNVNLLIEKIPERFQFLTSLNPSSSGDFVISVNGSDKEISEIRYEKSEKGLKIYLALNKGKISAQDVSFSSFNQNPDLLITLGANSLEDLSSFSKQNLQTFYKIPILNIDNQLSNENFGEINLIEIKSSLAEISANLIKLMDVNEELINGNIATCLLAGIIHASQNFRSPKTQPKTFETSALLIEKGADHQKIIQNLYKQKSIPQIKILGRILEKLNFDKTKELYCASLTEKDFQNCNAQPRDLSFVVEELKFNFRYLPNLLVLWESHASPSLTKGVFYSSDKNSIEKVLQNCEGVSKGEIALFSVKEADLTSAREKILKIL